MTPLKLYEPDACPFCGEDMKWRSSDDQWIHPAEPSCAMIGIGLDSHRRVYLWNTRDGEAPLADGIFDHMGRPNLPPATPTTGNLVHGPHGRPASATASKPAPPPPPPRAPVSITPGAKWVNLKFTVNGGGRVFAFQGLVDINETKGIFNERP